MKTLLLALIGLLAVSVSSTSRAASDPALVGTWKITRSILDGKEMSSPSAFVRRFEEDSIVLMLDGRVLSRREYTVYTSRKPKEMKFEYGDRDGKIRSASAIYKIEDGVLTICAALASDRAPEAFESSVGSNRTLDVYEKLKEKEPNQTAREQRAGCDLNRMYLLRSASSVVQKGSLHARPRVPHR